MQNNFVYVTRKSNDSPLAINLSAIMFFQPFSVDKTRIFLIDGTIIDINQSFTCFCNCLACCFDSSEDKK